MLGKQILVTEKEHGIRLDVCLAQILAERFSRSQVKKMIDAGHVTVNGNKTNAHWRVKTGDLIAAEWGEVEDAGTRAEDIPIEILYEDEDLIIVNKPAGMVSHPAHGNLEHTLVNALLFHVKGLSSFGGGIRPGIVHRLDKETSGMMVVAKNARAHGILAKQFKNHTIDRIYRVIVQGVVEHDEGICEEPIGRAFINRKKVIVKPSGGKEAKTFYKVLTRFSEATLLEVRPHTGRTHQIRVHMTHMDHPVIGDSFYGVPSPWIGRQCVHALALRLTHPTTRERVYFECKLPDDMLALLKHLESE